MRRRLETLLATLLLGCTCAAVAQTHPNLEKGFAVDKLYQFGEVDQVNLYSGNVSLTIPIGGSVPVSDRLSLSLTLVYNSKLWSSHPKAIVINGEGSTMPVYFPERRSNSGLGWTVSLGRLIDPSERDINNDVPTFIYQGPDGSDRSFEPRLHERQSGYAPEPSDPNVAYSRDNTYLRMRVSGSNRLVESPDGTIRTFQSYSDGIYTRWRIVKIEDRFGNHIDIDYSVANQWRITDQYAGRLTVVNFSSPFTAGEVNQVEAAYRNVVSSVQVQRDGGTTATYTFGYARKWVGTGFCGPGDPHPDTPKGYLLPLLTSVSLPDGTSYSFAYTVGPMADTWGSLSYSATEQCLAGELTSVTLPTRGQISYGYGLYSLPSSPCGGDVLAETSGVKTRIVHDPFFPSSDTTWEYSQSLWGDPAEPAIVCPAAQSAPAPFTEVTTTVSVKAGDTVIQKMRHYFSVWSVNNRDARNGTSKKDYSLPFTRRFSFGGRFLSTEVLGAGDTLLRATYVNYQYDYLANNLQFNANRRLSGTRAVFHDDPEVPVPTNELGKHYIDTNYADFDGVGHYRLSTTSGTLPGSMRTVTTAYNQVDPYINPGALATGNYDPASPLGGTFVPPPTTAPWVLNLYPAVTTTEGGSTAVQEFCFVRETGFLNATRTRGAATRSDKDLVTLFGSSSAWTGGMGGAVTSEKYYGGDLHVLTAPLNDSNAVFCTSLSSPGVLGYDMRHAYEYGVRKTSEHLSGGASVGHKFLDRDIDLYTGLTKRLRDTAAVETAFTYDASRRLLTATTSGDPVISYAYANATASSGAKVTISQASQDSGTPAVGWDFDGFGKVVMHRRSMPSETSAQRWTQQSTVYDGLGRKIKVSEWEEAAAPTHFTLYSNYDRFGRPGTISKPDNSVTNFTYFGVRRTDRESTFRALNGNTIAITKEYFDLHGRLRQVDEPNGNSTTYTYDVGGRLKGVAMTAGAQAQPRAFTYDNRGFLLSETHPELGGDSGNGTTTYSMYDARGHAGRKLTGPANGIHDIRMTYDAAERLVRVDDSGGTRELKSFAFGTSNSGSDKRLGKLTEARRFNYLQNSSVVVTETYKYEKTAGRMSERQTVVTSGSQTLQSFKQLFDYDSLGSVTAPGYPTCLSPAPCTETAAPGATFQYKDGALLAVPGYASKIEPHGSGMVHKVTHAGGYIDTYRPDSSGMPRPASIAFSTSCSPPDTPVISGAPSVCATSAGNTASVAAQTNVTLSWSIENGQITSATTGTSITYTASASGPVVLNVTATSSCGTSEATKVVNVLAHPAAAVSGGGTISPGQTATINVALTGTAPWSVTWSDGLTQSNLTGSYGRTVSPAATTTYSITSVSDASCTGTGSGSATVTVLTPLPRSLQLYATTQDSNSRVVRIVWAMVFDATSYRVQRTTCQVCPWETVGLVDTPTHDDVVAPSANPVTYLYRVIAMASGWADSAPSPIDYATTATTLFAESIVANSTRIDGAHVQELRKAIDAVRLSLGRYPYMTPIYANGWANYDEPTGLIYAAHVQAMHAALLEVGVNVAFTEGPAQNGRILAEHFTQLRTAVK